MMKCKDDQRSVQFGGILFLAAALLLCSGPTIAEAEATGPPVSVADVSTCKGLKPFNNIDELLYQFYINLESDCLFEMSVTELEEAWGIKILDEERLKPKNFYPLSETEFFNKPYRTEKDAFYVERIQVETKDNYSGRLRIDNKFLLKPTNDYYEKHGSLFHEGQSPKLLPPYNSISREERYGYRSSDGARIIRLTENGEVEIARTLKTPIKMRLEPRLMQLEKEAQATAGEGPCRGLKRYSNLNELLYQFYINLDSDCLLDMPPEELEKIWDTKILDRRGMSPGEYLALKRSSIFEGKPYISERDAFYVEIVSPTVAKNSLFLLTITQEYEDKNRSLIPVLHFPELLPEPVERYMPPLTATNLGEGPGIRKRERKAEGRPRISQTTYYWYSSDRKRVIYFSWYFEMTSIAIKQ